MQSANTTDQGNRLQLCAGRAHRTGWVTLDANPDTSPNILATIPPLPPEVHHRRWEAIELIHGIEHFLPWDAKRLLRECRKVLSPGGVLILEQPNLDYAVKVLAGVISPPRGSTDQHGYWPIYGDPNHRDPLFMHRWGYTPETLTNLLADCGFPRENIHVCRARSHVPVRDFRVEAVNHPTAKQIPAPESDRPPEPQESRSRSERC